MKPHWRFALGTSLLASLAIAEAGCAAVGGIFKAGVWVGVLAVVFIVVIIAMTTGMFRRS
jgi:hypothetical protein